MAQQWQPQAELVSPIQKCNGPLKYGVLHPVNHYPTFVAVTRKKDGGHIYLLERISSKKDLQTTYRLRCRDCNQVGSMVDGKVYHPIRLHGKRCNGHDKKVRNESLRYWGALRAIRQARSVGRTSFSKEDWQQCMKAADIDIELNDKELCRLQSFVLYLKSKPLQLRDLMKRVKIGEEWIRSVNQVTRLDYESDDGGSNSSTDSDNESNPRKDSDNELNPPIDSDNESNPPIDSDNESNPRKDSDNESNPPMDSDNESIPPMDSDNESNPPMDSDNETSVPADSDNETNPPWDADVDTNLPSPTPSIGIALSPQMAEHDSFRCDVPRLEAELKSLKGEISDLNFRYSQVAEKFKETALKLKSELIRCQKTNTVSANFDSMVRPVPRHVPQRSRIYKRIYVSTSDDDSTIEPPTKRNILQNNYNEMEKSPPTPPTDTSRIDQVYISACERECSSSDDDSTIEPPTKRTSSQDDENELQKSTPSAESFRIGNVTISRC